MVVLAVALFAALSSCAFGCSGSTNSVSVSFVRRCRWAGRQMEHESRALCNKTFFSPSPPDVASLRQICAELLSRRTCKENRAVDYIKINYLQSCVTRSSLVWHFVPLSLFLQTEPKPWRMENQPLDVQLAAVFRVIMWITFDWMFYQLAKNEEFQVCLKFSVSYVKNSCFPSSCDQKISIFEFLEILTK